MMKISRQMILRRRQAMMKLMKSKQKTELLYMIFAMQRKIADDEKKADVHQLKAVEDKAKGERHISFIDITMEIKQMILRMMKKQMIWKV